MALNMVYASDVIEDAIEVLQNIDYRGGMAPASFLQAEVQRLRQQGRRAADAVNVALVAMGKSASVKGAQATEAQMATLVTRLQREQPTLLASIGKCLTKWTDLALKQGRLPPIMSMVIHQLHTRGSIRRSGHSSCGNSR